MKKIKSYIVKSFEWILRSLARLMLWRYRPGIIGITGSAGKTSTKFAVAAVLGASYPVRASRGNFNTEMGLCLAILGDWSEEDYALFSREFAPGEHKIQKFAFLMRVIFSSAWRIIAPKKAGAPEILILEYGIDKPYDMKRLLAIARPNITIITAIGETPVHVEFFPSPEDLAREKARLVEYLPAAGYAILNMDDEIVMNMKDRTRARPMTFGFGNKAQVHIAGFEHKLQDGVPTGISFKLEYGGSFVPVRMLGVFGRAQAYAAAAAACVGIVFGMNLVAISEGLSQYKPPSGRMRLLQGMKNTLVLDDSYNASPLSVHAALDTIEGFPGKRKVAVLGDMLELGRYSMDAHRQIGEIAGKIADVLVTVGLAAKFIAEGAHKAGMKRSMIHSFDTVEQAQEKIAEILKKEDLVLIKASHAIHLDRLVSDLTKMSADAIEGAI